LVAEEMYIPVSVLNNAVQILEILP